MLRKYQNEQEKLEYEEKANVEDVESMYKAAKANCCSDDMFDKNDVKALNMFCSAASQGHSPSMLEVGRLYMNDGTVEGSVIPYDPALAYAYFTTASRNGYSKANFYRSKLLKEMSEEEFARATMLTQSFPVIPCKITR